MIAKMTVITKAKSGTRSPCLTPERLAIRPATYPPIKKAIKSVRSTPMRPAMPPPVVAELPPRTEKIAPTMAPTIALSTRLTPSATNQPIMTLVQLVPSSTLSLTPPPFEGNRLTSRPRSQDRELVSLLTRLASTQTDRRKGLYRAFREMHHGSPGGILYSVRERPDR